MSQFTGPAALAQRFGDTEALDARDLGAPAGQVLVLLGLVDARTTTPGGAA